MPPKKIVEVEVQQEPILTQEQLSKSIFDLTHHIDELRIGYNDLKTGYDQLSDNLTASHARLEGDVNQVQASITCLPQIEQLLT